MRRPSIASITCARQQAALKADFQVGRERPAIQAECFEVSSAVRQQRARLNTLLHQWIGHGSARNAGGSGKLAWSGDSA